MKVYSHKLSTDNDCDSQLAFTVEPESDIDSRSIRLLLVHRYCSLIHIISRSEQIQRFLRRHPSRFSEATNLDLRMLEPLLTSCIHQTQTIMSKVHLVGAYWLGMGRERRIDRVGLAKAKGTWGAKGERCDGRVWSKICISVRYVETAHMSIDQRATRHCSDIQ